MKYFLSDYIKHNQIYHSCIKYKASNIYYCLNENKLYILIENINYHLFETSDFKTFNSCLVVPQKIIPNYIIGIDFYDDNLIIFGNNHSLIFIENI